MYCTRVYLRANTLFLSAGVLYTLKLAYGPVFADKMCSGMSLLVSLKLQD